MRIVFMGTPEFAVPCLERLVSDGHEVVGVGAELLAESGNVHVHRAVGNNHVHRPDLPN